MALRKEEFHYEPNERKQMDKDQPVKRQRLTIDISAELGERIQEAASQQNLSIDQYLESLLREAIPTQPTVKRVRKPVTLEDVEKLMQVRDRILQEHGGIPFEDSIEMLRQERKERERDLDFHEGPAE